MNLAQETAAQGSLLATILPLILMFVIFYFLLIRPQQKRTKQRNVMLSNLKKNDKVITIGGLYGTIIDLTDDKVTLRVNESTKLTFDRNAINGVVEDNKEENKK
ncbi:preprotein translocase subunit YajC [Tepidibacillus infernus]|uniref:Preprotein translocase subunit YajC n=1 Tax=Tepidibacillus decaturensis TaxID=1413211 RepID=A0A135L2B2_9BACI|nr:MULTISPECIES: preprotein translocase subunit YajC [Tepidibacillus]KXG43106.1 preprotein translocase subunit YajC [Tepidibacillus decaturensis]GBF10041.1 preprotein translocase subunit YajC [Tepidibacillus sp. HK-1]